MTSLHFVVCCIYLAPFISTSAADFVDDDIDQRAVETNSKFKWIGSRDDYVMPWTRGPNVCAVEEVAGGVGRRRYYPGCLAFAPKKICKKQTFIRFLCCTGYEKEQFATSHGCSAVKPIEDLPKTIQNLFLREFRSFLLSTGHEELLYDMNATYTVFGPQNQAFSHLSAETREQLSIMSPEENSLVRLHIVKDRLLLSDLRNGMKIKTLYANNQTLHVHRYSNWIVTINCARIVLPDQLATNGVVHITEKVIPAVEEGGTVFGILDSDDRFDEFVTALTMTTISTELEEEGRHFTVFAPTNAAFNSMDPDSLNRIMRDVDALKRLLYYHIVDCCICSASILGPTTVKTLEGQRLNLSCDHRDRLLVNEIVCSEVDVIGTNGVIHVVDELLVPDSVKSFGDRIRQLGLWTFADQAKQSGMDAVLEASEHVTVFVPNDEAFRKATDSEKRKLNSGRNELKRIMDYHTVSSTMTTKKLIGTNAVFTGTAEQSKKSFVNVNIQEYTVNNARIVSADHVFANGVIHVIDRVLLPPEGNIMSKIREHSNLSFLVNLLSRSGIDVMLNGSRHHGWTFFAPSNAAFDLMDKQLKSRLMTDTHQLIKFLNYHIIERAMYTCEVRPRLQYRFQTLAKDWIRLKQDKDGAPIVVNGMAKITHSNVDSRNGVVHVVDHVLVCPCLKTPGSGNDV